MIRQIIKYELIRAVFFSSMISILSRELLKGEDTDALTESMETERRKAEGFKVPGFFSADFVCFFNCSFGRLSRI